MAFEAMLMAFAATAYGLVSHRHWRLKTSWLVTVQNPRNSDPSPLQLETPPLPRGLRLMLPKAFAFVTAPKPKTSRISI